ncbi:MAG: RidA family protein [Armatimonadetes bacterium]|nr:RidA family protein [Armatimonadota bacterium]
MLPINPESLGAPRGYSNGMLAPAGGRLLFIAGQVAWDREQRIVSQRFAEQFRQALGNVLDVVREAGGGPRDIGQMRIYVRDKRAYVQDLAAVGVAYRELMGRHYPAMALVEVQALLEDEAQLEIEATAVLTSEEAPGG